MSEEEIQRLDSPPGHLADETLVSYADGELGARAESAARRHLKACWRCRARCRELEESIGKLALLKRRADETVRPPKAWREFPILLGRHAETEPPGIFASLSGGGWSRGWTIGRAAAVLFVLAGVLVWTRWMNVPTVQAKELLRRAEFAESSVSRAKNGLLYQRLRLDRPDAAGETDTNTLEVWYENGRGIVHHTGGGDSWKSLSRILKVNGLVTTAPFSAHSFTAWRGALRNRSDEVQFVEVREGGHSWALTTLNNEDVRDWQIRRATLVVRASDWQPVRLVWEVATPEGRQEFEFTGLEFRVVERTVLASVTKPATSAPLRAVKPAPVSQAPLSVAAPPSREELEIAELQARQALHLRGDCLRGAVRVERSKAGRLSVAGVVGANSEKEEIRRLMPRVPFLTIHLRSIEELTGSGAVPPPDAVEVGSLATAVPTVAAGEELLRGYRNDQGFGASPSPGEFMREAVELSQQLRRHAWALDRLRKRYPGSEAAGLPPAARHLLADLVVDHVDAMHAAAERSRRQLEPVAAWVATTSPNANLPGERTPPAAGEWGEQVSAMVSRVDRADRLTAGLFAGAGSLDEPVEQSVLELAAVVAHLEAITSRLGAELRSGLPRNEALAAAGQIE